MKRKAQVMTRGERVPAPWHLGTSFLQIYFYILKGIPPAIQLVCFGSFVQLICPPGGDPRLTHLCFNGPFIRLAGSGRNHLLFRSLQLTDRHLVFFSSFIRSRPRETWLYLSLLCWMYHKLSGGDQAAFNRPSSNWIHRLRHTLSPLNIAVEKTAGRIRTYFSLVPD